MVVVPESIQAALDRRGDGMDVVVIRLAALGDVLRALPPVRLIRQSLPRARLSWVVDDRWSSVLEGHPDIDRRVLFPRRAIAGSGRRPAAWPASIARLAELRRELTASAGRCSIAIDFHGNLRSGLAAAATRATVRLGYDGHQQKEGNRWFLSHRVPSGDRRTSRMDRNLGLLAAVGLPTEPLPDAGLTIDVGREERVAAIVREAFGTDRPFAILNPGASPSQAYKKPPTGLLAEAARALAGRNVGAIVVWGPGERDDAAAVVDASGAAARLAPATSLPELAGLLRRAAMYVGGDTGPMHLACAVGCPVVAVYGPTDPDVNAPWGVPFRRVVPGGRRYTGIKKTDRASGGFSGIAPADVTRAVDALLTDRRAKR